MHPALSVIFFTSFAGAGYGMLFLLGLLAANGHHPADLAFVLVSLALAFALTLFGLLCSTRHLGHPERAWRAFSQWRSSWLSREGVAVLLTFLPAGGLALAWPYFLRLEGAWVLLPLLTALGAVAVVYCTAQIYASLKTIPAWHQPLVPALYLLFALASGSLLVNAVTWSFGIFAPFAPAFSAGVLLLAWSLKLFYWRGLDRAPLGSTTASATGLVSAGQPAGSIKPFDPPHAGPNYVMTEMGHRIGRRHARKLRRIALCLGGVLPLALSLAMMQDLGLAGPLAAWAAALGGLAGILTERWLFFAEARHVVTAFYRNDAA